MIVGAKVTARVGVTTGVRVTARPKVIIGTKVTGRSCDRQDGSGAVDSGVQWTWCKR
jgi:hypothetical protein